MAFVATRRDLVVMVPVEIMVVVVIMVVMVVVVVVMVVVVVVVIVVVGRLGNVTDGRGTIPQCWPTWAVAWVRSDHIWVQGCRRRCNDKPCGATDRPCECH